MTQAVILAGGRGKRLAPLTDSVPKPMADVDGEPFLAHLLGLLARRGLTEILVLTGYRGDQIRDYFGSGDRYGLRITYSEGPETWSTGERLLGASESLESTFLLLYADNYVAFDMSRLFEQQRDPGPSLTLTVCPKLPGNVVLSQDGTVLRYFRDRSTSSGNYVEVGFSLTNRDRLLHELLRQNGSLPATIESLAARGEVRAHIVEQPYFSVSDAERLEKTRQALGRRRVLLLDRDGVINVRAPEGEYVSTLKDFKPITGNWEALCMLAKHNFSFVIISNQAGVARGLIRPSDLEQIHQRMIQEMRNRRLDVLQVYVCPHHWEEDCLCRKPRPGMFFQAASEHNFLLEDVIYVGDDVRDEMAAVAAGCTSILIGPEGAHASRDSTKWFSDLTASAPFILDHYQSRYESGRLSSRLPGAHDD